MEGFHVQGRNAATHSGQPLRLIGEHETKHYHLLVFVGEGNRGYIWKRFRAGKVIMWQVESADEFIALRSQMDRGIYAQGFVIPAKAMTAPVVTEMPAE